MTYYKDEAYKFLTDYFFTNFTRLCAHRITRTVTKAFSYLQIIHDVFILCIINGISPNFENHTRRVATGTKFDIKTQNHKVSEIQNDIIVVHN